jgi:hypothetical protein
VTVNNKKQTESNSPDNGLSKLCQKNAARNIMTIVYLQREDELASERFTKVYASVVYLSQVSHGEKSLSKELLAEYSTILGVSEDVLLHDAGATKARHSFFMKILQADGLIPGPKVMAPAVKKDVAKPVSSEERKLTQGRSFIGPLELELSLASLLG